VRDWNEERQTDLLINQREAIQADAEAKSLAAQTNMRAQRMLADDQMRQYEDYKAQQQIQEQTWKGEQDRLSAEAKAVASSEVNPNRVFSGAPMFQTLGLAIAAGLKGYATSGRDTSVLDTVQKMIDRDISVQEAEIARKKGEVDNALARNIQRYGSIEAGRAATRAQQLQATLARFDANVAAVGLSARTAQIEAERKKFDAAAYDAFEQTRVAAMGTTTTATQAAMVAPRAATAGGWRNPNDKEIEQGFQREQGIALRGAEIGGKRLANEGKDVENDLLRTTRMNPEQLQRHNENVSTRQEHMGSALAGLASTKHHIDQIMSLGGITEDKEGVAHHNGIPGIGVGYNILGRHPVMQYALGGEDAAKSTLADMFSVKGGRIRRESGQMMAAIRKDLSGVAFSPKEVEEIMANLGLGYSQGEDAFAQAMVDTRRMMSARELEIKAGAGKEAVKRYEADKSTISQDEQSRKDGVLGAF
jgi:hypothetical protein